jgi:hypothetical protein
MQRYLIQLMADLENATRLAPVANSYSFLSSSFEDEEGDSGAMYVRLLRLCDLFELSPDAFPPVERLTKVQVADVLNALEKLWRAWQISWECPPRLSARRRYSVMVEWMRREGVRYHPDRGASLDFCEHREQGGCPFGNAEKCWCAEIEASARHDLEIWEQARTEYDENGGPSLGPVDDFFNWLNADGPSSANAWDEEEEEQRWRPFMVDEDSNDWLYFYRPEMNASLLGEEPLPSPEDFDDFDWHDPEDGPSRKKRKGGAADDDFELPF